MADQTLAPNPAYIPGSVGPGNTPYLTPTVAPATPDTINSANTTPTAPIPYVTPTPTPTYPVATLTTPTPVTLTPSENSAQSLTSQIEDLDTSLEGKSADQTADEASVGLPALEATQNDLGSQLDSLKNEAQAIPLQLQQDATGRGITAAALGVQQTARLRTNAIAALGVSSLISASQGQIANAQAQVDKMVAQKYDPIQAQIDAATANLKLITSSPEYTEEEKSQAQDQLNAQAAKQAVLDKAKANDTAVQNTAISAAQNISTFKATSDYPTAGAALKAIAAAPDPASAQAIATSTGLVTPVKLDTSVQTVNGRKVLVNNQTGEQIKDLGADTTGTTAASMKSDIQDAVTQLQTIVKQKGFKGVDPGDYQQMANYLQANYGTAGVAAFKTALNAVNLSVDSGKNSDGTPEIY